jgi:prevent-host-death family protein
LRSRLAVDKLVSMTRIQKPSLRKPDGSWALQDAKAHFSEVVRRARSDGPQHVTVHGREEVVVISAQEFRALKGETTGAALIAAVQASPYRDIDLEPERSPMPVREIEL